MMLFKKAPHKSWLVRVSITAGLCIYAGLVWAYTQNSEERSWEARGFATADNPKAARVAIIEAIYARRIVPLAEGYERAVQQKPNDPVRIANFAHAAAETNFWYRHEEIQEVFSLVDHGYWTLRPLIKSDLDFPPYLSGEEQHDMEEEYFRNHQRTHGRFMQTTVADAWLAWSFRGAETSWQQIQACQKAIALDPTIAEAYYQRAGVRSCMLWHTHSLADAQKAFQDLQYAEKLEPRLHTLCLERHAQINAAINRSPQAAADRLAYQRSWPDAEGAEVMKQDEQRLQREDAYAKSQLKSQRH